MASVCTPSRPARPRHAGQPGALRPVQPGRRPVPARGPRRTRRASVAGSTATPASQLVLDRRRGTARRPAARPPPAPACIRRAGVVGAVAEPDDPLRRVVAVVGELLDPLAATAASTGSAEPRSRVEQGQPPGAENTSSRATRLGEVARRRPRPAGRCGTRARPEEGVGRPRSRRRAVGRARPGQQQPGLAEQVERDVGQRGLFLQLGRAGQPLLQPVRHDQRVVAEHQAVRGQVGAVDAVGHRGVDPASGSVNPVPNAQRWSPSLSSLIAS